MSNIERIKAEIKRRKEACKTKNGFPAGTICAIRIETYEGLLSFINSLPEEKPSEDLEEAAESYEEEQLSDYGYRGEWSGAFIAGANWQKEQMMKDAVDAEITLGRLPDDWSLAYNPDELHRALLKFKSGDKVKIIIVKGD